MITPRIHSQAGGRPRGHRGRVRLTYANVTSTLALVIALGGASAYAASYVITSVNQIQPNVLTQFRSPVLHAFNGATSPVSDNGKLLTHLALPAGSAALLHATVSLSIHGKRGTDAYASCTLYSAGFKGAGPQDTMQVGGPVGTDMTVPLELSSPATRHSAQARVYCMPGTGSASGDTLTASNVQEDAVLLQ